MSALSEAIERANKRLAAMPEQDRIKYYAIILQQELRRPATQSDGIKR